MAKVNEVWETKSGRLCLIVNAFADQHPQKIMMLWFDEIDQEMVVCDIESRLDFHVSNDPKDFFNSLMTNLFKGNNHAVDHR